MNKTGTIEQIVPDGGYQGQKGYIHTFQMTVKCPDGTFTGQIGSKSAIYPLAIGQEISVEVTNTEHGVRFKKFNPQYAQGGSQGGQRPNAQLNDKEVVEGKYRCEVICAAIQSRQIEVASEIDCDKWVQYIILGHNRAPSPQTENIPTDQFPDDEVC